MGWGYFVGGKWGLGFGDLGGRRVVVLSLRFYYVSDRFLWIEFYKVGIFVRFFIIFLGWRGV